MYWYGSSWLVAGLAWSYLRPAPVRQEPQQEAEVPAHQQEAAGWGSGSPVEVLRRRGQGAVGQVAGQLGVAVAVVAAAGDAAGAAAGGVADAVGAAGQFEGVAVSAGDAAAFVEGVAGSAEDEELEHAQPVATQVPDAFAV